MAEIRTEGLAGGDVVTEHRPPEAVRDWVERHEDAVKAASVESTTLRTTWPVGGEHVSEQQSGETPALHKARHWRDAKDAMRLNPPDPS